ncbi:tripartite tricarboxylate transporter substrate binding protein [Gemmobacter sp.]|uniref:tripartite tricarboxylate transporter substrate binding protein n=1 Tax=Gemmobacter sp. TaxID=1898957 RepID=UPI002AFF4A9D|nr:tripartite tricarboxylate transporter substrate binding protein [Gemmobacter sp.]
MLNSFTRRGFGAALVAGALALAAPFGAMAADGPVTIVVPYGAGGTTDAFARMLADGMSKELGRTVLVENKPGANGILGATYVAKAKPDGATLLWGGTGPVSLNAMLRPSLPYTLDSFDSVAMLFDGTLTLTVPTKMGVNSIEELVAYAKTSGKPLRYGTLGPGSVTHLYGLILSKALDVPVVPVAYKNNPSSLVDLIGGQAELSFATPIALVEHAKAGDLKIMALTTTERDPAFADVPSVTELGHPELVTSYWSALHAPKGTPKEVIDQLAAAAVKTVQSDAFRELLAKNGQYEKAGGPEALDAQLATDRETWGKVIADNNIVLAD